FVLSPTLLMMVATAGGLLITTVTALIGMVSLSSALIGYLAATCHGWERLVLIVGGLLMINPGLVTDLIGAAMFAAILMLQLRRSKASDGALAD
ncbi:MAG: DUF3394 domain-containing protein, partial [Selenomonas sp.]|nr:DUF3394 domain-containing protein [Selenomonas sp.]